jgi:hypothetical protein
LQVSGFWLEEEFEREPKTGEKEPISRYAATGMRETNTILRYARMFVLPPRSFADLLACCFRTTLSSSNLKRSLAPW